MWTLLTSKISLYIFLASLFASVAGYLYYSGYDYAKDKQAVEGLRAFKDTTERINETTVNRDRDAAIERLRQSGDLR